MWCFIFLKNENKVTTKIIFFYKATFITNIKLCFLDFIFGGKLNLLLNCKNRTGNKLKANKRNFRNIYIYISFSFILCAWNWSWRFFNTAPLTLQHMVSIVKATVCSQCTVSTSCLCTVHYLGKLTLSAICSLHCTADTQTKLTSDSFSNRLGILWSIRTPDRDLKSAGYDISHWLLFPFGKDGVIAQGRQRPWGWI